MSSASTNERRKRGLGFRRRTVVDDDDRGGRRLVAEGLDRAADRIGSITVNDHDGDDGIGVHGRRHPDLLRRYSQPRLATGEGRLGLGSRVARGQRGVRSCSSTMTRSRPKPLDTALVVDQNRGPCRRRRDRPDPRAGLARSRRRRGRRLGIACQYRRRPLGGAGIEVVMRTPHAAGSPPRAIRDGYESFATPAGT